MTSTERHARANDGAMAPADGSSHVRLFRFLYAPGGRPRARPARSSWYGCPFSVPNVVSTRGKIQRRGRHSQTWSLVALPTVWWYRAQRGRRVQRGVSWVEQTSHGTNRDAVVPFRWWSSFLLQPDVVLDLDLRPPDLLVPMATPTRLLIFAVMTPMLLMPMLVATPTRHGCC